MMIKILSNRLNLVKKNVNKLVIINQTRQYANVKSDDLNVKSNESTTDQPSHDLGHFDIVINGGGIVGLTFLFNLQTNQFLKKKRILLIEQQNRSKLDVKTDNKRVLSNRVSSLTEASKRCFEKNGIWSEIDQYVKRIREMQIWSSNLNKAISFDANDELGSVCYIVENNRILNALNRNLDHEQILYSTNVVDIKEIDNKINLFTESKLEPNLLSKLTCNLLIGCDGYNSLVRQKSNLDYFNLPLDQNGVVGTITMCPAEDNSDNSISYQRFLADPQAVIAILPLTNEESSFVISTDKMFAKQLVEINEKDFVDQFNHLLDCEIEHCLPYLIKNLEVSLGKSLPTNLIKSTRKRTLPKISAVQSRASFPLGFGTTLPSLVGSIRKSSNINLAIIGNYFLFCFLK